MVATHQAPPTVALVDLGFARVARETRVAATLHHHPRSGSLTRGQVHRQPATTRRFKVEVLNGLGVITGQCRGHWPHSVNSSAIFCKSAMYSVNLSRLFLAIVLRALGNRSSARMSLNADTELNR